MGKKQFISLDIDDTGVRATLCALENGKPGAIRSVVTEMPEPGSSDAISSLIAGSAEAAFRALNTETKAVEVHFDRSPDSSGFDEEIRNHLQEAGFTVLNVGRETDRYLSEYGMSESHVAVISIGLGSVNIRQLYRGEMIESRKVETGIRPLRDSLLQFVPEYGADVYEVMKNIKIGKLWKILKENPDSLRYDDAEEEKVINEIATVTDQFVSRLKMEFSSFGLGGSVESLVLTGIGSEVSTISEVFEHYFKVPVHIDERRKMQQITVRDDGGSTSRKVHSLAVAVALVLVFITGFLTVDKLSLEADLNNKVEALEQKLQSEELKKALDGMETRKEELTEIRKMDQLLDRVSQEISQMDVMSEELLKSINEVVPSGVLIHSFEVQERNIVVTGVSREYRECSLFAHSLRDIGVFETIQMGKITSHEYGYQFSIQMELQEETLHEK